nr:hypothetical protein CFP56_02894 [Quercus suber]
MLHSIHSFRTIGAYRGRTVDTLRTTERCGYAINVTVRYSKVCAAPSLDIVVDCVYHHWSCETLLWTHRRSATTASARAVKAKAYSSKRFNFAQCAEYHE